jgi:hypothetical protein
MKGKAMDELKSWQQGHDAGINLAVKLINEWCHLNCKTIAEVIREVNKIQEVAHD